MLLRSSSVPFVLTQEEGIHTRYAAAVIAALALAGCERTCGTQAEGADAEVASTLASKGLSSITLTPVDLDGAVAAYKEKFKTEGRSAADAHAATERCAEENWNLESMTPKHAIVYAAPNYPAAQQAMMRDIACRAMRDLMFETET